MLLKIKELRLKNNLSQIEFAEKVGISVRSLIAYEKNNIDISLSKLKKIADCFDVSVIELLEFADNEIKINTVNEPTPVYGIKQHEILDAKDEVIQSLKRENALLREMLDQAKSKQG
jgi:transcriptional regulator with XRE-family HTH domain